MVDREGRSKKRQEATKIKADNLFAMGLLTQKIKPEEWHELFSRWRYAGSLEAQKQLQQLLVDRLNQ